MSVRRPRSCESRLLCSGSRCMTTMMAASRSFGRRSSTCPIAVRPPAEATSATAVGACPLSGRVGISLEQQPANAARGALGLLALPLVPRREILPTVVFHPLPEPARELGPLLQSPERHPQCVVERLRLRVKQPVRAEGMADAAAEPDDVVRRLAEHASAGRARERRLLADAAADRRVELELREFDLLRVLVVLWLLGRQGADPLDSVVDRRSY